MECETSSSHDQQISRLTLQFPLKRATDGTQIMAHTPRLERKNAFRIASNDAASTRPQQFLESRPSFTVRMFKFIFNLKPRSNESRPKSWSGQPEPEIAATTAPLVRHVSAKAIIPSGSSSSAQLTGRTRPLHEESVDDEDDKCSASWRQRQIHCVNCERLFFTFLSPLSCSAGRFCSLDCKTNFEYVSRLEKLLTEQMFEASATSSDLMDSSSDEDYQVEEFDVDQL